MKKNSAITLAMCMTLSAANLTFADSQIDPMQFGDGQHSTFAIPAIPTSSFLCKSNIIKTAQISYPTVYVSPAYSEKWFSTVRVCNALANAFSGDGPLPIKIQVFNDGGGVVKTIPNISLLPNSCRSYTSDVAGDPLFDGLAPGVYSVTVTVIAKDAEALEKVLKAGGNLTGAVNSTARDYLKS